MTDDRLKQLMDQVGMPNSEQTMNKKTPTGFVATCQCGVVVGAMDYRRTDSKDAGQILGKWLHDGCTVEPRFSDTWTARVERCRCEQNLVCKDKENDRTA